jgi:hypothetical protein
MVREEAERVISLELAKRLKDAGLRWEPKIGDCAIGPFDGDLIHKDLLGEIWELSPKERDEFDEKSTWLPNLSQLLGEIEGRGWEYEQGVLYVLGGPMMPGKHKHGYWCEIWSIKDQSITCREPADTPEEAAGRALLWVLTEGRGE